MILMCEKGAFSAAKFNGAGGGGGMLGTTLSVDLVLRDLRSCVAQESQQSVLGSRQTLLSYSKDFQEGLETHEVVYHRGLRPLGKDS